MLSIVATILRVLNVLVVIGGAFIVANSNGSGSSSLFPGMMSGMALGIGIGMILLGLIGFLIAGAVHVLIEIEHNTRAKLPTTGA